MFKPPTYARSCCMAMLGGARAWFPAADVLVFGEARWDRLARGALAGQRRTCRCDFAVAQGTRMRVQRARAQGTRAHCSTGLQPSRGSWVSSRRPAATSCSLSSNAQGPTTGTFQGAAALSRALASRSYSLALLLRLACSSFLMSSGDSPARSVVNVILSILSVNVKGVS
jgi:hypothetical protein